MFLLLGTMPVYAVIQDRGFQNNVPVTSNDDVMTSIANMDKTLSALNSKLPSLIESRFKYYESIQRQNQVKQVIAELGAFLIALMIYALIRNKNDRETERALTRSEQILTNIETRIHDLENSDEVNVNVVDSKPIIKQESALKELKDKDVVEVLEVKNIHQNQFLDELTHEEKVADKPIIYPSKINSKSEKSMAQQKLKTVNKSKQKKNIVKKKDDFLGIDKV